LSESKYFKKNTRDFREGAGSGAVLRIYGSATLVSMVRVAGVAEREKEGTGVGGMSRGTEMQLSTYRTVPYRTASYRTASHRRLETAHGALPMEEI